MRRQQYIYRNNTDSGGGSEYEHGYGYDEEGAKVVYSSFVSESHPPHNLHHSGVASRCLSGEGGSSS